MCIICYKPKNVELPDEQELKRMFNKNPHGAGFCYPEDGKVVFAKGFMTFGEFMGALETVTYMREKELPIIMHFRISTQAGVTKETCHPFPLSANLLDLELLNGKADYCVFHNGTIKLTSNGNKRFSDTQLFVADYMTLMKKMKKGWFNDPIVNKLITRLIDGSRMAIMNGKGEVVMLGNFTENNGRYYSNEGFMDYKSLYADYYDKYYADYYDKYWDWDEGEWKPYQRYTGTFGKSKHKTKSWK